MGDADAEARERVKARAVELATGVLEAAVAGEWKRASDLGSQIAGELGGDGVLIALVTWCDTFLKSRLARYGPPAAGWVPRPSWLDAQTGRLQLNADQVSAPYRWVGRLVCARYVRDDDMFTALVTSVPAGDRSSYAGALVCACAAELKGET